MPEPWKGNVIGSHENPLAGGELQFPQPRLNSLARIHVVLHSDLRMLELDFR
jgi:hypothetical protein